MFGILAVQRRKIQEALQITIKPVYGVRMIQFNEGELFFGQILNREILTPDY